MRNRRNNREKRPRCFRIVERFACAQASDQASAAATRLRALAGRVAVWHSDGLIANLALMDVIQTICEEQHQEETTCG